MNQYIESQYNSAYHSGIKLKYINKFMNNIKNIKPLSEQEIKNIYRYIDVYIKSQEEFKKLFGFMQNEH